MAMTGFRGGAIARPGWGGAVRPGLGRRWLGMGLANCSWCRSRGRSGWSLGLGKQTVRTGTVLPG
jgi:hypothetical protein